MRLFQRLRTQLIVSHLIAIASTLIAMVTAVVLIAGSWFASQRISLSEPVQEAQVVASSIGGLINQENASPVLPSVLQALSSGKLRVEGGFATYGPWAAQHSAGAGSALHDVAYIAVVSPEDELLASVQNPGEPLTSSERQGWKPLVQAALAKPLDPQKLVHLQPTGQPAAIGAYPVLNAGGQPLAVVILASRTLPPTASGSSFWHSLLLAVEASAALLAGSSVFALISAGLVGYLLSRRLVRRLESLGGATEKLARGDLTLRVEEGPPDEVGQLARRFNEMAGRLAETVSSLTTARQHTEAALAAKRELVANVSHELRTPLALIRGYVETLECSVGEDHPAQWNEYLAIVGRETENLSRLIDDLFTLSTAETSALPLNLEPVPLGQVVQEVGSNLQPLAQRERQIRVVTRIEDNLPLANADRQRVVQILGNLVRNSLRHTPEGGLIALSVARQDDWIVVSVEDTGEGIPTERLPHVFERFYRGDKARSREDGGTGLGLAIVRELVEAMGGEVGVESQVGQGSWFWFRLPVVEVGRELSTNG